MKFLKILGIVSGDFKFKLNPHEFDENFVNLNLIVSDAIILFNNHNLQYKFSEVKIDGHLIIKVI